MRRRIILSSFFSVASPVVLIRRHAMFLAVADSCAAPEHLLAAPRNAETLHLRRTSPACAIRPPGVVRVDKCRMITGVPAVLLVIAVRAGTGVACCTWVSSQISFNVQSRADTALGAHPHRHCDAAMPRANPLANCCFLGRTSAWVSLELEQRNAVITVAQWNASRTTP